MSAPALAESGTRTVVVHVPDWPIWAAGVTPDRAAMVVRANRVVAASPPARAAGIEPGLRRREAQRRQPHVAVLEQDPASEARTFERLAGALDAVTPGVEVTEPGTAAFASRGPSRYFGGDASLAERVAWMAGGALGGDVPVCVGVAEGPLAPRLAAEAAHRAGGALHVLAPGGTAAFLAPQPVGVLLAVLPRPDLVDVWQRLGLRTLGHLAALERADLLARFGHDGAAAHRLASGLDLRPLDARRPAPDLAVNAELDPPADRVDRAAFVAKALADQLHARLEGDGLACTQVLVEAETEHGEHLGRRWRHEGALSAGALADRVRWQLDGWLAGSAGARPTSGIVRLALVPVEVVAARGRQLGFWGGETQVDERVWRAVARLQALLGAEAVAVPEVRGGRGPAERVARVPAASVDLAEPRAADPAAIAPPWPGRVPPPSPATVLPAPEPVAVLDADRRVVAVSGRSELSAAPAHVALADGPPVPIASWAGPWPVDERWWDPARHRRRARFQVVTADGDAHLLAVEGGRWWREATYD